MGVLQQGFNQALTGATFLMQQTPWWKHKAELWGMHDRLKSGSASEQEITQSLTTKPGEKGVAAKNQKLALDAAFRNAYSEVQEEQAQKAAAETEAEQNAMIARRNAQQNKGVQRAAAENERLTQQTQAIAEFQSRLQSQILNPQKDILSPEEIKQRRIINK